MTSFFSNTLLRRLTGLQLGGDTIASGNDSYDPTPLDIVVVRIMLTRSKRLPPGLVDSIIDFAEYWAHSTTEFNDSIRISGGREDRENRFLLRSYPLGLTNLGDGDGAYSRSMPRPLPLGQEHDAQFFTKLAKYPTPTLASPARKVVFSIKSKDQGWVTSSNSIRGSYHGSWTWFEAGLERFDADHVCNDNCTSDDREQTPGAHAPPLPVCGLRSLHPVVEQKDPSLDEYRFNYPILHQDEWEIQCNKVALREFENHVITWSYLDSVDPETGGQALKAQGRGRATGDGEFVRGLKFGDVITVWGKARFGGWANHVESVKVDVWWAV